MSERPRIDAWLKHVCLLKTRSMAADACRGGHVKINGQRVKPAAPVHEGDIIEFLHGTHYRRVVVSGLPASQLARDVAKTMYVDETPRQEVDLSRFGLRQRGAGRPTKRDRRELDKIKR